MSSTRHQPDAVSPRSFAAASIFSITGAGKVTTMSSPTPSEVSWNRLFAIALSLPSHDVHVRQGEPRRVRSLYEDLDAVAGDERAAGFDPQ